MNVPRFLKHPIDTSVYNRMIKTAQPKPDSSLTSHIAECIRKETGVHPFISKKYRGERSVLARQLFMALMNKYTDMTNEKVAEMVGKDRTTIHHSVKAVQNRRDTDKHFNQLYLRIEDKLNK